MGRGLPIVSFTKHNINTNISTETEIVGVDEFLPAICWNRYFIAENGYSVSDNCLHQDNNSSILLENNRKASSRKIKTTTG